RALDRPPVRIGTAPVAYPVRGAGGRSVGADRPARRARACLLRAASRHRGRVQPADHPPEASGSGRLPHEVQGQRSHRLAAAGRHRPRSPDLMARLPADPEGFIRANTALAAPAMVPEFKLWLASEYVPIWQATEAWLEEQNVGPPYWAFCWPGGQAIARYLLDNPELVRGRRVIDFAAGSGVSSMAAARAGAVSVIANDIDRLSLVAARLNAEAN